MKPIRTAAEIVAAASAAYPDDYIAEYFDAVGNRIDPKANGDALAEFILSEILSAADDAADNRRRGGGSSGGDYGADPETDPVTLTIARLEVAVAQIQAVIMAVMAL